MVKKKIIFTSLFSVTPNHYGRPKRKWVPISWLRNLFLKKLMKSRQQREKFFVHYHRKVKRNSVAFKISKNSKEQDLVGVTQVEVIQEVSSGLHKVKLR